MNPAYPTKRTAALSVSQLNREVKALLENSFMTVQVEGEISNLARPSSGHWYFTLKDERAQVRCAMFKGRNLRVGFRPKEGDLVTVLAKVSLYEGRGDFQLICEQMKESGTGRLQAAFEQLKHKLAAEGLFDQARKRTIPPQVRHLGVITSPSGAAIHDILQVLERRCPSLPVALYPTAVQGTEAASQIVQAIELANRDQRCDVLIVGRGGGSLEDLWPFNEERVARAIAASHIPIVSAVGHEVDISISDLVADLRAPTPSAAAELVSPDRSIQLRQLEMFSQRMQRQIHRQLQQQRTHLHHLRQRLRHPGERLREQSQRLDQLELRLQRALRAKLQLHRQRIEQLEHRLERSSPDRLLARNRLLLMPLQQRLQTAVQRLIKHKQEQLSAQMRQLHGVSPLATLERGYAIVQDDKGQAITSASQVQPGDRLITRLHHGQVTSRVEQTED
ncbi:exodeoxyribonuclease VII large subunit [Marinobacterium sp. AK62]|uniref:Exodeoxyribonuclease 7 large subunit n=1 Tax=Marinobacterium alkalitolerans TaxID=1542925 RepID=A0ABS3ZAT0_9GAMM|nr:exodeoxyribonuclease VII large subunit [Marinobacterium alkalitolerans]MBP0048465.1 exodeoxyribonuclease VII large subunit [Marinobacterium alkalitolerans]